VTGSARTTVKLGAVVAIPARNEEAHLGRCLGALGSQRQITGEPLPPGSFGIVLLLNNCDDGSAELARTMVSGFAAPLRVIECDLPPSLAHAGGARRRAMNEAAAWLGSEGGDGLLLTTDADSRVDAHWVAANLAARDRGADAVAGRIALDPDDAARLPEHLHRRGRLETAYGDKLIEISAILDPRPHNPWPHHATASGASLAVTLATYRRIGGLPQLALGEDRGLIAALEAHDARTRFAPEIEVITSGRLVGRAPGGVADTIRLRCRERDALCDETLEPVEAAVMRAWCRGRLRRLHGAGRLDNVSAWATPLGLGDQEARDMCSRASFGEIWRGVEGSSPALRRRPLRPRELPGFIARAAVVVETLRRASSSPEEIQPEVLRSLLGEHLGKACDPLDEELGRTISR
jgi:hypothetical protein